jgi:hypothetical protein
MELSENLKLRLDTVGTENPQEKLNRAPDAALSVDAGPIEEAESQMRRALGLLGDGPRHRPDHERQDPPHRGADRFSSGLHRRRFVQDGDIPVTVLRRDQGHEVPAHRGVAASTPPTSSRLQRTEAALAAETAARERAERSLAEVQALVHDLQTKIGHAELAKNESIEALRRERETSSQIRVESHVVEERLQGAFEQLRGAEQAAAALQDQLDDERGARKAAEKALRGSDAAREAAEQLVRALSEEAPAMRRLDEAPVLHRIETGARPRAEPEVISATARRGRPQQATAVAEPEPVKWWLNPKPAGKRR